MSNNKVFKATAMVMIITIISRFLGLGRDILAAYHFGAGSIYDIYSAAVAIPESVFMIVGLAISTTFIPMLSEVNHKYGKKEMFKFSNNVITILSVLSIIVFILGMIFTEEIVKIFVSGFTEEQMKVTVFLTKISLINIFFLCINVCFLSILQVCEDFIIPAILGLFFNLPIIIYLLIFKDVSILGLTVANVIGNSLRVLVQIPSLYKKGYRIRPFIDLKDSRIKRILILILPVIVGAGANSLNMIVDKNIASSLAPGSISALEYSQKIVVFANTAITTSIVSVIYPVMANRLNSGDKVGFLEYMSKSIVIIALFLVPLTMAFIFLRNDIINIFYSRGAFGSDAAYVTSIAFLGYAIQLPFFGARDILNSSLFSMQKTKVTKINGIIGVVVNILLSITLSKYLGVLGVSLATSIAAGVTALLLLYSTKRIIGEFDIKPMLIKITKIMISSSVMILGLYLFNNLILLRNSFITIIIDFILGSTIFIICTLLLKVDEFIEAIKMITNKFINRSK
ncbi:murein biosynthesis integral membrane protein MurJ [Clostridium carnis]